MTARETVGRSTMLRGARVFDPISGDLSRADVLIVDQRIAAVGKDLEDSAPDVTIDVGGASIVPGFINVHEHLTMKRTWGPPSQQVDLDDRFLVVRGVRGSLSALRQGFTTVRELGAKNHLNLFLKRAIKGGMFPGPRVLAAGAPISITGGHVWKLSTEADGPDGMRRAVRATIKAGADWIKLIASNDPIHEEYAGEHTHPEMLPEEVASAVRTAHASKRRVTAHVMGSDAIASALDGGVDSVEHGVYLTEELAARMAITGTPLVPTLSGYHQSTLESWGRGPEWIARHEHLPAAHTESTSIAIAAGVRIGVGTDTLGDFVEDLSMLIRCGMTSAQALAAATYENSKILALDNDIGLIRPGMLADMVVLRDDPLDDVNAVRSIEFVIQSGVARRPTDIGIPLDDENPAWNSLGLLGGGIRP